MNINGTMSNMEDDVFVDVVYFSALFLLALCCN